MAKFLLPLFMLLLPFNLVLGQSPYVDLSYGKSTITLLQLLSDPQKFHGKEVLVIGYLNLEFESDCLWLHKEDYSNAIVDNSIWVISNDEMIKKKKVLNKNYVIVRGTFDANNHGHLGMHLGALVNLTRCDFWSNPNHPRGLLPPPPVPPFPSSGKPK